MNQDDVIRMAREAGWTGPEENVDYTNMLRHFAALVAAHEREECAKVCDELGAYWAGYKDTALLNGDIALSNAASGEPRAAEAIAKSIRARGSQA
jgi:hypothetical protein